MVSCVGDDDFGRRQPRAPATATASMFRRSRSIPSWPPAAPSSRYRADGSREFVFNIKHSASGADRARRGRRAADRAAPTTCMSWGLRSFPTAIVGRRARRIDDGQGARRHRLVRPQRPQGDARAARACARRSSASLRAPTSSCRAGTSSSCSPRPRTRRTRPPSCSAAASARSSSRREPHGAVHSRRDRPHRGRRLRRRGGRPDRRRRLFRRGLRQLLAAAGRRRATRCASPTPAARAPSTRRGPMEGIAPLAELEASSPRGATLDGRRSHRQSRARRRRAGERAGIASICSAHPLVIEAALRHGKAAAPTC